MDVEELIKRLQELPKDAEVKRQMTAEYGTIEVEEIRYVPETNSVVID